MIWTVVTMIVILLFVLIKYNQDTHRYYRKGYDDALREVLELKRVTRSEVEKML